MKLSHESPELKRKSRSGIPTPRNLLPAKGCSIAPWYYLIVLLEFFGSLIARANVSARSLAK
jgi:hypothetical protein